MTYSIGCYADDLKCFHINNYMDLEILCHIDKIYMTFQKWSLCSMLIKEIDIFRIKNTNAITIKFNVHIFKTENSVLTFVKSVVIVGAILNKK